MCSPGNFSPQFIVLIDICVVPISAHEDKSFLISVSESEFFRDIIASTPISLIDFEF